MTAPDGHISDRLEAVLVSMAQDGDQRAFTELVTRYQSWLRNLMRRFSNDHTLADDLAQQAFLTAWKSLPGLRERVKFGGWLKRIALTTWLQHVRKNDPLYGAADEFPEGSFPPADPALGVDLDRALAALPSHVRTLIVMSYHENMTHGEIAEALDMPVGTVKSHIRRGTIKLKEMLSAWRQET